MLCVLFFISSLSSLLIFVSHLFVGVSACALTVYFKSFVSRFCIFVFLPAHLFIS